MTHDDRVAQRVYALLSNGMGGVDWAGLPFVVQWLGVHDVDALMDRLYVLKTHRPPGKD